MSKFDKIFLKIQKNFNFNVKLTFIFVSGTAVYPEAKPYAPAPAYGKPAYAPAPAYHA